MPEKRRVSSTFSLVTVNPWPMTNTCTTLTGLATRYRVKHQNSIFDISSLIWLQVRPTLINMVREPVERLISNFYYLRSHERWTGKKDVPPHRIRLGIVSGYLALLVVRNILQHFTWENCTFVHWDETTFILKRRKNYCHLFKIHFGPKHHQMCFFAMWKLFSDSILMWFCVWRAC